MEGSFRETTVLYRSESYTGPSCAEALSWIFNSLICFQMRGLLWLHGRAFRPRYSTTVSLN